MPHQLSTLEIITASSSASTRAAGSCAQDWSRLERALAGVRVAAVVPVSERRAVLQSVAYLTEFGEQVAFCQVDDVEREVSVISVEECRSFAAISAINSTNSTLSTLFTRFNRTKGESVE